MEVVGRWWEGLLGPCPEAFSKACRVDAEALEWWQSWHLYWLAATHGRHLALPFRDEGRVSPGSRKGLDRAGGIRVWWGVGRLRIHKDRGGAEISCWKFRREGNVASAEQSGQVFIRARGTVWRSRACGNRGSVTGFGAR